MTLPHIDPDRLWGDVEALSRLTDPDRPFTRRAFTDRFLEGRAWLRSRFEQAGLAVSLDPAGNLIGRREGARPELGVLALGSHSDTVPAGGRFDGIAGVLAGLEVLRSLPRQMDHTVEIIDFLAEEPNIYGLSCVGSRGMSGHLGVEMLGYREPGGETLGEGLKRMGGDPARLDKARRSDIAAYLELHIEQGPLLENRGIDVGVVTGIVGITRHEVIFEGRADHAGTTPMFIRKDALAAAARLITAVRSLARDMASAKNGYFVATVGSMVLEPNAANVVPSKATLLIEARSTSEEDLEDFGRRLDELSLSAAEEAGVARSVFTRKSRSEMVDCDKHLRAVLKDCAAARGISSIDLASGAGHDAMFVAQIAPMAMIFIPCREGRSHCPEEFTGKDSLAAGAQVLLDAMIRLDQDRRSVLC